MEIIMLIPGQRDEATLLDDGGYGRVTMLGGYRRPLAMPEIFAREIAGWAKPRKSPYSDSFYSLAGKDWDHTPTDCLRVADHWNFNARGTRHCVTDTEVPDRHWAFASFGDDAWTVLATAPAASFCVRNEITALCNQHEIENRQQWPSASRKLLILLISDEEFQTALMTPGQIQQLMELYRTGFIDLGKDRCAIKPGFLRLANRLAEAWRNDCQSLKHEFAARIQAMASVRATLLKDAYPSMPDAAIACVPKHMLKATWAWDTRMLDAAARAAACEWQKRDMMRNLMGGFGPAGITRREALTRAGENIRERLSQTLDAWAEGGARHPACVFHR